ncbi:Predicted phosphoesterase [Micromonospora pallida]|uniref:Predicted phosphoesterase n=1 Tax=Micromonospora pallida TaxID=145854 RepID=A0A1C6SHQ6_9ACTN|nr:metallophosphoesterase [Micromonospora pallida]SCL28973.1 Predicted phosphoesterase [Micromonospora pallida]
MRPRDGWLQPVTSVTYRRARTGGGSQSVHLPVDRITVDRLPAGCRAVLVAGDLQGIASPPSGGDPVLLGVALADHLTVWAEAGLLPPPSEVGVLLAGDLYSAPDADRRGASGDVTDVWLAFAVAECAFVVGVAGNHDEVDAAEVAAMRPGIRLLDGDRFAAGGVLFGGVGGVTGAPDRPGRRGERDFLAEIAKLTGTPPVDVLVLHEGPSGDEPEQLGNTAVRRLLERRPPALTVCGHVHWDHPVSRLGAGRTVNVDGRVLLLVEDS